MADLIKISNSLHPLERKILPLLAKFNSISELVDNSGLKDDEVIRALQWLRNKELINLKEDLKQVVLLDKNGIIYQKSGLPE